MLSDSMSPPGAEGKFKRLVGFFEFRIPRYFEFRQFEAHSATLENKLAGDGVVVQRLARGPFSPELLAPLGSACKCRGFC